MRKFKEPVENTGNFETDVTLRSQITAESTNK